MKQKPSENLQAIYELELALGNKVSRVLESLHKALPLAIMFERPLHRAEIESQIKIPSPVKWWNMGKVAGYVSEDNGQSLQGPTAAIAEVARDATQKLSMNLLAIYELELSLGNTVVEVNEQAGSPNGLAIIFKDPLHKAESESTLSLSSSVKWLENHDPHYPIQGGYKCEETSHVIAGPLR